MTVGHGRALSVVLLLLFPLCFPVANASGGGLLLSGDSFSVTGDQEVGAGDVNFSIDVVAHNLASDGFLEMTFTEANGNLLASDNRSINLLADESSTEFFSINSVPIGTHTLTLELWGDIGIGFENNLTQIQLFIQRYSPASASIDSADSWTVTPVDSQSAVESGNETLRDGDHAWIIAAASNSGDITWQGNASISIGGTVVTTIPTSISGTTSTPLNFSLGPFFEGSSTVTIELYEGLSVVSFDSLTLDIGPPPLARPELSMTSEAADPDLGDNINWTASIQNTGESNFDGTLTCSFPTGVEILNQSVVISSGGNQSWNLSIDVRPGTLECSLFDPDRIHLDSILHSNHTYDMSAGHLMRAGSDGLTITGGPFHVGDAVPLAILIHNGGDFAGEATLEIREGDSGGANAGPWITMETRTLEVGSSLELGSSHASITAGNRQIDWRIVSSDSLVAEDLSGSVFLSIQPPQSLDVSLANLGWTLDGGLQVEVTTILSSGESRLVLLELGTSGASGNEVQFSVEIELTPGQRTLTYNLGQPTSSSVAWVELTPNGWTSSTLAEDEITLIRPEPRLSVVIDSVSPPNPIPGEPATLSYTLVNEGGGDTLSGELMLIDVKGNGKVLWTSDVSSVESGENSTGTISLAEWPEDSVVDINLIWHTSTGDANGMGSYLSQTEATQDDGLEIDWMSIVYGTLTGLILGLVTRTVMRARAGEPLLSRRERGQRIANAKKTPEKVVDEKVEVACPACDQRLRVPSTYSGTARCPACAQTFPVQGIEPEPVETIEEEEEEEEEEEDVIEEEELVEAQPEPVKSVGEKSSTSGDDVIKCPDCSQKLKVPYDRRPVRARCPACKCEFRALQE